jgi:N4-gp56 family major capsid protein
MKEFLWTPNAHVYLDQVYKRRKLSKRSGAAVLMRHISPMPIAATPSGIAEGVSPTAQAWTPDDYTGTVQRYAEVYEMSRQSYDLSPFDEAKEGAKQLRVKVDRVRERVRYNAAKAGTGVYYNASTVSARNQVNGTLSLGRLQRSILDLRGARAETFTEMDGGSDLEGTSPVEACFVAFCSTDLEPDIRLLPGFKTVSEMSGGSKIKGAFGVVQNVLFVTNADYIPFADAGAAYSALANLRSTASTAYDVYPILIVAQGALTGVDLAGESETRMGNASIDILDGKDKSDPTGERVMLSSSWYDLPMITGNAYLRRIEVGCTANPQ